MFSTQVHDCDSSTSSDQQEPQLCQNIGQPSSEREIIQILAEYQKLYESRIAEVDADTNASSDRHNELKLKIMTDWVKDLGEVNTILLRTVHDLEQEAVFRVELLERKLQNASNLISKDMLCSDKSEDDLNKLEKRICQMESEENILREKIFNLKNDTQSLLEFIRRGRLENNWDLDGITFYEINASDIPAAENCLQGQKSIESCEVLTEEVAQKCKSIKTLESKIDLENKLKKTNEASQSKDDSKNIQLTPIKARRVRMNMETCQKVKILEDKIVEDKSNVTTKQIEELQSLIIFKDNEISKFKTLLNESQQSFISKNEILDFLKNLRAATVTEKETIFTLKKDYELMVKLFIQLQNKYSEEVALVVDKMEDIRKYIHNYIREVIDEDQNKNHTKEFISNTEKKIIYIQKLFKNKCEMCIQENVIVQVEEIILKITSGITKLSEICENKTKTTSSIRNLITKNKAACDFVKKNEQEAMFAAILQQFRMMEEFRICTVEVQAATEDLREEISAVLLNLNSQHSRYVEFGKTVNHVQDYLTKTRENISEVVNCLELQDEERARHNERITNNRIRLKDIKNKFNQTQFELSECLNNVQNNFQQTNLLGYTEIYNCNDLLIAVVEEVEQIACNLDSFQIQDCCTLSSMTELRKQLTVMENNLKDLKTKSNQVLLENEAAQKSFNEKSKRLEKYENEIDNCHTKMQDILESIIIARDEMNEFECVQENEEIFQNINEILKMKDDLRKLQKECEELKCKKSPKMHVEKSNEYVSEWEYKVIDLQDQIKKLQNEMKCKQRANDVLKKSIELLEKELASAHTKAEDYRRGSLTQCLALKKKVFELESSLRVQKDVDNNFEYLPNNQIDLKKSQFFDYINNDQFNVSTSRHSLQTTYESMSQLFKTLQDAIQSIKNGLQDLIDNFTRLVPETSSHTCSSKDSIKIAISVLIQYIEATKACFSEIEKIKAGIHSKDKLMENMDEIIKNQKNSITILQTEVETLRKTLQEKEKTTLQLEIEKKQINKQIELQEQTIGHLQDAVVEAKRTIDQLTNKAKSDNFNKNKIIRSLNLYLTETQNQYDDCFSEASEQDALLELQRDTISSLQKRISFLECDEFLNAVMLHFIYYIILIKYQEEMKIKNQHLNDMKTKMDQSTLTNASLLRQRDDLRCKYEETHKELEKLSNRCKDSPKKTSVFEKQRKIDEDEYNGLKQQLQVYKLDFDIIEEEMKKMGMMDRSVSNFKFALQNLHSKNEKLQCELNYCKKLIRKHEIGRFSLQKIIECKDDEIKNLEVQIEINHKEVDKKIETIEILKIELDRCKNSYIVEITALKSKINILKNENQCLRKKTQDLMIVMETCHKSNIEKDDKKLDEINKLNKNLEETQKYSLRLQNECKAISSKYESCERNLQCLKNDKQFLEKQLAIVKQKLQNCANKNDDLIRQNKSLEDDNSKCMTELEDIVLQLEDLQSSFAELKTESDVKSQSLDRVSAELTKIKVRKSEACKESKVMLEQVCVWMREQTKITKTLQNEVDEKQQQLLRLRNVIIAMKRLKRTNRLTKKLKILPRPTHKSLILLCNNFCVPYMHNYKLCKKQINEIHNNFFDYSNQKKSNAIYSHRKKECKRKPNCTVDKITSQGNPFFYTFLKYLSEEVPRAQIDKNALVELKTCEDERYISDSEH